MSQLNIELISVGSFGMAMYTQESIPLIPYDGDLRGKSESDAIDGTRSPGSSGDAVRRLRQSSHAISDQIDKGIWGSFLA